MAALHNELVATFSDLSAPSHLYFTIFQEGCVLVSDPLSGMKTSAPIKASFAMSTVLTLQHTI